MCPPINRPQAWEVAGPARASTPVETATKLHRDRAQPTSGDDRPTHDRLAIVGWLNFLHRKDHDVRLAHHEDVAKLFAIVADRIGPPVCRLRQGTCSGASPVAEAER